MCVTRDPQPSITHPPFFTNAHESVRELSFASEYSKFTEKENYYRVVAGLEG